jgi:Na+-transporting methylmalonyl-CoA/oxaloacetate decarboxylase gamma subunit
MNDLAFGLQITVVGMGLVFGLLALLWALLALVGRLEQGAAAPRPVGPADVPALEAAPGEAEIPAAELAAEAVLGPPRVQVRGPGADELEPEALAAITAAVLAHAADRRRQAAPETRSYWPGSLLFASRWVSAGRARQNRGYQRERR